MNNSATIRKWVSHRLDTQVSQSLTQWARTADVRYLAVMPDVHLGTDVCIGTVLATQTIVYPAAVGSDIGCGILTVQLNTLADRFENQQRAANLLDGLYRNVPRNRHPKKTLPAQLDTDLLNSPLSDPRLEKMKHRDGRAQLGSLGRGNHFLEFQSGPDGKLWLMIHSGSRAMGQAITNHHLELAGQNPAGSKQARGVIGVDSSQPTGAAYLKDMQWARRYAATNRLAMMRATLDFLFSKWKIEPDMTTLIHTDHNHVQQESHFGQTWWVHRKGAQQLAEGEHGIVPGSMGTSSFLVAGRGCEEALQSCSHGAGRKLSRTEARRKISAKDFAHEMKHVWFDHRKTNALRDESPRAYKDVRQVMRAQRELVRIVAEQSPVLNFKGS